MLTNRFRKTEFFSTQVQILGYSITVNIVARS